MIDCISATLVALRLSLAMGNPVADASLSAEAVWEACSEAQQYGLSDLEPDEARAVVAATEGDLGYRLALESARECTTPVSYIERHGELWYAVCATDEGEPVSMPAQPYSEAP